MLCESSHSWLQKLTVALAVLAISIPAFPAEIAPGTPWTQANYTRLDASFPGGGFHARWDFFRCDYGDVLIHSEEILPDGITTGEQLLVGGRILLQRGFEGGGPAMLDSPMLMLQLLFVLLQKAQPSGPAAVDASIPVEESDKDNPIKLDTGKAQGAFPAPWGLQGELRRVNDGSHRFELQFTFDIQGQGRSAIDFSGVLDYREKSFPHEEDMALESWSMHFINEGDAEALGEQPVETLGQLRAAIRKMRQED